MSYAECYFRLLVFIPGLLRQSFFHLTRLSENQVPPLFENGNIGALTHRLAADRATLLHRGNPKPSKVAKTPRVVELLRKAIEWQVLLESGEIVNQADIARQEGITRARVTQVMGLLRLSPEIQEQILSMPNVVRPSISERMLRPIAAIGDHGDQLRECGKLRR